jgi:hypothetical protein
MSTAPALQRTPLVISAGTLVAGPVHASFSEDDPGSLLHSYLVLVRRLRGQQREHSITLRGADISALAGHLGCSEERVLDDLLARMGATRAQRKALAAMFAVGALTIVATGSIALELSSGAAAEGIVGATPAVEAVQQDTPTAPVGPLAVRTTPAVDPSSVGPTLAAAPTAWPDPELSIAGEGADWEVVVALQMLTQALADQPADAAVSTPVALPLAEGEGVADDGSTVAVGTPPAPLAEGEGVADDGSTVAVGTPPAPPVEGQGVADDGSIVAVGTPPVPPPPGP